MKNFNFLFFIFVNLKKKHFFMQLSGKIVTLLPLQQGKNPLKNWVKQDVVIQTHGEHSRKICISCWNEHTSSYFLNEGNEIQVDVHIESKEYNCKWYTNLKVTSIKLIKLSTPKTDSTNTIYRVREIDLNLNDEDIFDY